MKETNYSGYQLHVGLHNKMLEVLISKSNDIRNSEWESESIIKFMDKWISHLITDDKDFANYIRNA